MSPVETCGIRYRSMMRLACVPLPAPGGPSNTTGPTSREVSCAIELAKASRTVFSNPTNFVETLHATSCRPQRRRSKLCPLHASQLRPVAPSANTAAARRETIVVAHNQLRFNLRNRIHGHAHHDQKRCSTKIEIHSQTVRHPDRKPLKQSASQPER